MALGTQSCLAWFLGPDGRGSYAICLLFGTLLGFAFGIGCDAACVYFVSSKRFTISEGILHGFIYSGIGSCCAIITGLIIMQLPLSFLNKATPTEFYFALGTVPFSLFSLMLLQLLTAIHQFGWFAIMSIIYGLAKLSFTFILIKIFSLGVNGALLGIFTASIITISGSLIIFHCKSGIKFTKPSIRSLLDILHYGIRYHAGKISNLMNFRLGTIILAFFATRAEIGLFDVAANLATVTIMIPDALITVLIPRVAGDKIGKKDLVARCSRLTFLFCCLSLPLLAIFTRPIVAVLFSPAFLPAVLIIRLLLIGVFVRCICKVFVSYLLGTNHPGIESISVGIGITVNLLLLLILLPIMGLTGAAIAMVAGYFASSSVLALSFSRLSGMKLTEIWRFRASDLALLSNPLRNAFIKVSLK